MFVCLLSAQVFLKEPERQQLQDTLHKDVMRKIIFLQRWFKARLQRKEFLDMRRAAILIQVKTVATSALVRGFEQKFGAELISPVPFFSFSVRGAGTVGTSRGDGLRL